jgi:hypothetical protein
MVKSSGLDKPTSESTEADHRLLTPEEHQPYYGLV